MPECCGGARSNRRGAARKVSNPTPAAKKALPGKGGMERLEYIGRNEANSTWWGPVTNTRYVFGRVRRIGYVDAKDAAGMVAMKKEKRPVFRIYKPPAKPKPLPAPKQDALNIVNMKARDIKVLAITAAQVPALLAQERGGKDRKTIVAYLEGLLDA